MPRKGYWAECVPVNGNADQNLSPDLYSASISSLPEISVYAPSPDKAIEKLRTRLKQVKHDYEAQGQNLPYQDNPVRPPNRLRFVRGWMSVYINVDDLEQEG